MKQLEEVLEQIKELRQDQVDLLHLAGEMLATLKLPRNVELIEKGLNSDTVAKEYWQKIVAGWTSRYETKLANEAVRKD